MRRSAAIALAAIALGAAAPAGAEPPRCRDGQQAVRGKVTGGRLVLGRGPVIACARPAPVAPAARYHAAERFGDRLVDPRLRRLERAVPRLRRGRRSVVRVTDRFMVAALRRRRPIAGAARRTDSGPLPGGVRDGVAVTGRGLVIHPDEDEVGAGRETEYTGVKRDDGGVRILERKLDRQAAFADKCPGAGGKVPGDFEYRHLSEETLEARGRREIKSTDERVTASFEGHVDGDAVLTGYDLRGDVVIESRGRAEVAATGKLLVHVPTRVVRGTFELRGGRLVRFAVRGPQGLISDRDVAVRLFGAVYGKASVAAEDVLGQAQEHWRALEDKATGEQGGRCVKLELTPQPLPISEGETKPVEARLVVRADGTEVAGRHRIEVAGFGLCCDVTPLQAASAPGTPARLDLTAKERFDGETVVFYDVATSERGRARATATAVSPATPRAYVGEIRGSYAQVTESGSGREEWATTDARFDRVPGSPDVAPRFVLAGGRVHWTAAGSIPSIGCSSAGAATFEAAGADAIGTIEFGSPAQYVGRAEYTRRTDVTWTCNGVTHTGSADAWPVWWDSNANSGTVNTTGAGGRLSGRSGDPVAGLHWEWDLRPVF